MWRLCLLAALLASACRRSPRNPPDQPMPSPASPMLPTDSDARVGRLYGNAAGDLRRPADYCVDGQHYRGAPARLQRVNVFGVTIDPALLGRTVMVHGEVMPSLWDALEATGPCPPETPEPMAQMRSDWVADEGGYRTTRAKLAALAYLRATRIAPVELHRMVGAGERSLTVRLFNPFAGALEGTLTLHYEGGPTKPMPRYDKRDVAIAPGGQLDVEAPRSIDEGGRRVWRLSTFELSARAGRVIIDATLPLD